MTSLSSYLNGVPLVSAFLAFSMLARISSFTSPAGSLFYAQIIC
jgi:hypothetical protein